MKTLIIHKKDRDWRDGAMAVSWIKDDRRINNVDAFDWNGTHLWNIGDIIGDIKMAIDGISLTTYDRVLHEDGLQQT